MRSEGVDLVRCQTCKVVLTVDDAHGHAARHRVPVSMEPAGRWIPWVLRVDTSKDRSKKPPARTSAFAFAFAFLLFLGCGPKPVACPKCPPPLPARVVQVTKPFCMEPPPAFVVPKIPEPDAMGTVHMELAEFRVLLTFLSELRGYMTTQLARCGPPPQ